MMTELEQADIEVEVIDPDAEREKAEERLQAFGHSMGKQRDEWIRDRSASGVEKRWREDEDQYNCKDNVNRMASQMMASVEQGYPVTTNEARPHRSTVFIGLTRQKTNAAEARVADILLPTDDRNWGISPTPVPMLTQMATDNTLAEDPATGQPVMKPDNQPARKKDVARAVMELAHRKAQAMQSEIDDQLSQCDYNGELRKVIHDAAVLGTGGGGSDYAKNALIRAARCISSGSGQVSGSAGGNSRTGKSGRTDVPSALISAGCVSATNPAAQS